MNKPGLVFLAIALVLINACGRVTTANKMAGTSVMNEAEAMNLLSEVPLEPTRAAWGKKQKVSAAELTALIQKLVAEGKVKLPANVKIRQAVGGGIDLSQLTNVFTALQSGGIGSLFQLSQALIAMNNGSTTATGGGLEGILAILQAVAPIIAAIAPQFAPIISALMTIVPLVITFINLFKKPSAAIHFFEPVRV